MSSSVSTSAYAFELFHTIFLHLFNTCSSVQTWLAQAYISCNNHSGSNKNDDDFGGGGDGDDDNNNDEAKNNKVNIILIFMM